MQPGELPVGQSVQHTDPQSCTSGNHVIMSILLTRRKWQSALPVRRSACASTAAAPPRGLATLGWSHHGRLERNQAMATNVCGYKGARQSAWGSWLPGRGSSRKTALHCAYALMYKWAQFAAKKHTVSITATVINEGPKETLMLLWIVCVKSMVYESVTPLRAPRAVPVAVD